MYDELTRKIRKAAEDMGLQPNQRQVNRNYFNASDRNYTRTFLVCKKLNIAPILSSSISYTVRLIVMVDNPNRTKVKTNNEY